MPANAWAQSSTTSNPCRREVQQRLHVRAAAKQMRHEDEFGRRRDGPLPLLHGRRHLLQIQIDRRRHEPMPLDDSHHVGNGDRRNEHFAATRQAERVEQEVEAAPHGKARQRVLRFRPELFHSPRSTSAIRREADRASPGQQIRPANVKTLS